MSVRYVGYIAMSLDGFVADSAGSVGWLDPFNSALAEGGGDGGYGEFIADVDALLVGRTTYEQVMGWGWPYEDRKGYVLTRAGGFTGEHVAAAGSIDHLRAAIEAADHKKVWIMGGGEAQRAALDAGMFHSIQLFIMPILLGGGAPMMAPGATRGLDLTAADRLPGGIMTLTYDFKE